VEAERPAIGGCALINVLLDVGPLPPRSSSPTVAGCQLGGFPVGRDQWGGESVVGGLLPRINIGTCRMTRVGTGTHCPIGFVAKAVPVAWK